MKNSDDAVRADIERYRITLQSIGDAVIATDAEGRVEFVNPVAEALTGWPEEDARGRKLGRIFQIINENTREKVDDPVSRVLKEGTVVGLANHTLLISRDGRETPIADSGAPIRDESGKITGVVLVFRDQSEERRIQQALRESESFLQNVFEAIQDGISVLDRDLNVIRANHWMEEHYSDHMPLKGRKCYEVYQQREDVCPRCPVVRTFETGRAETEIVPYPSEENPVGWIELTAFPIMDEQGRVANVIEYVKDISRQKKAEHKLRKSEERYRMAQRVAGVGTWEWNIETEEVFWSDKVIEIWGLDRVGFKGSFEEVAACVHPDDFDRWQEDIRACVEEGREHSIEMRVVWPDGTVRWVAAIGDAERDEEGRALRLMGVVMDITDRRNIEADLRREKEFTDTALDAQLDTFFLFESATGKAVRWNRAFSDVTGYTDEEIAELPAPVSYYSAEDLERAAPFVEAVLNEGIGTIELGLICKDGRTVSTEYSVSVIRDDAGDPKYLVSIGRDISERKLAESALRDSEKRNRQVVETISDGLAIVSVEGAFLFVNAAFCEMYQYSCEEMFGIMPQQLIHPDYHPVFEQFMQQIRETGQFSGETVDFRKDGTTFNTDVRGARIEYAGKECFLAIIRDASDRKHAEESLRESERQFRSVFESGMLGTLFWTADGSVTAANNMFLETVGYTREELLSGAVRWRDLTPPEYKDQDDRMLAEVMSTGVGTPVEKEYIRKDGSRVPVLLGAATIPGSPDRGVAFVLDISERKLVDKEREKLQAQLQQAQKMEAVGRLAGGVAHDFNNMLGVILGRTEMVMMDMKPEDPHYEDLEEIRKATGRSAALTNQLLAFARRQNIAPKVLDLNETIEWMLRMLRRLIGEDIDLAWNPATALWRVKMDPTQVDQILANLCVNARDAIIGNGKITIETGNTVLDEDYCADHPGLVPGEFVMLAVSDDGLGMDLETQSHLFEPFFTTKEVGKGTGLGLATIFGIVRQNDGYINVYSEPGHGSTFKIYIPRHEGLPAEAAAGDPSGIPRSRGETVLLVEDALGMLTMGRKMLERLGYTVLATSSPDAAIDLARRHPDEIELLLTDVVMPGLSGKDLAGRVLRIRPEIRVLYMSGYTANVIAHHGVLDEGVHFLPKPFSLMTLGVKIREVLDGSPE